jgi:hypothetical protein
MNERIRELAEQCYHRYSEHNIDLEKFAELIVRQCADIADSIGEHGYIASEEMLEQFGVEE